MASFGETLKRERESRNISLREIAETTKINIRHLEALEADRFNALPGGVFNRGFVRAYADYLGIDADAAVRDFHEAMSASGVESNEGTLPHPDRVAHRARNIGGQTVSDSGVEEGAAGPRISMGPDPGAIGAARDVPRPAGRRRFMTIAFWAVVGGALLAGLLVMRSDRRAPPPEQAVSIESQLPAEPSAEQEAFDPPEGMFVDAGPAVEGEVAAGNPNEQGAAQPEPVAEPPPQEAEAGANREPRRAPVEPAVAGVGGGPTPRPVTPPAAQPKAAESQPPEQEAKVTPAAPDRSAQPPPAIAPPRASDPAPPPPGPLALEVEVTRETWLWLACDSNTRIDRRVRPGESTAMQCLRSIRVSAHDAGAVRLRVNGADCMPLGDDGARVYGYTIRFDDAHLICRSARNN
jgi:transcriptional regulator with XRE-family HTH domain